MTTFNNKLEQALIKTQNHWQEQSQNLIKKLEDVINFAEQNIEIAYLYFEHDFETLDIFYYFENNERILINDYTDLYDDLMPKSLFKCESDLADEATESDEMEDLFDEYCEKKYQLFEQWFLNCWQQSTKNQHFSKRAFFSSHDSYFIFDLQQCVIVKGDSLEMKNP